MKASRPKIWAILSLLGCSSLFTAPTQSCADTRMHGIAIDTDDSPGTSYLDIVQADDGSLTQIINVPTPLPDVPFLISDMMTNPAVIKTDGSLTVIQLELDPGFDPTHGGYVKVNFLYNGITSSYKDFRILIGVEPGAVTFTSEPDPQDQLSDDNPYTSTFNHLFFWKRTLLSKEIGIDRVQPSLLPSIN